MASDPNLFVANSYTVTWGSIDLGFTVSGFELKFTNHLEDVNIDLRGASVVDQIYRGRTTRISFNLTNPTAAAKQLITFPYDLQLSIAAGLWGSSSYAGGLFSTTFPSPVSTYGHVIAVGQSASFNACSLVLTPITGINSNAKVFTIFKAIIDTNNGGYAYNSKLKVLQCNFLALVEPNTGFEFSEV